jgi:preprotein translocase subunit SecA
MVSNAIKSAQTQVESQNFEMRKNVLKYDDVMNRQREVIYRERREVLEGADIKEQVITFIEDTIRGYVGAATSEGFPEEWDLDQLWTVLKSTYPISFTVEELEKEVGGRPGLDGDYLAQRIIDDILAAYTKRESDLGAEVTRELERKILLSVLDRKWREHLYEMDYLQEGIGLRAMAQRDPLVEYQKEGFDLFSAMMDAVKEEIVGFLFNVEVKVEDQHVEAKGVTPAAPTQELQYSAPSESGSVNTSKSDGVSRNAPCPCGSGKKYKRCHGAS